MLCTIFQLTAYKPLSSNSTSEAVYLAIVLSVGLYFISVRYSYLLIKILNTAKP